MDNYDDHLRGSARAIERLREEAQSDAALGAEALGAVLEPGQKRWRVTVRAGPDEGRTMVVVAEDAVSAAETAAERGDWIVPVLLGGGPSALTVHEISSGGSGPGGLYPCAEAAEKAVEALTENNERECAVCRGSGKQRWYRTQHEVDQGLPRLIEEDCGACRGTGRWKGPGTNV